MRLITAERLDRLDAEHWIAQWEREAEANGDPQGSQAFCDDGWEWITAERASTRRPG